MGCESSETEHKIKILLRSLLSHIIFPLYGILPISIKIEYSSLLNSANNENPTMVPVLQLLPNLCHLLYSKIYLLSVSSSHLVLNVFHWNCPLKVTSDILIINKVLSSILSLCLSWLISNICQLLTLSSLKQFLDLISSTLYSLFFFPLY